MTVRHQDLREACAAKCRLQRVQMAWHADAGINQRRHATRNQPGPVAGAGHRPWVAGVEGDRNHARRAVRRPKSKTKRQQHVIDREHQRRPEQKPRHLRHLPQQREHQHSPDSSKRHRQGPPGRRPRRIHVANRDKHHERQEEQDHRVRGGCPTNDVQVEHDDVPVRRETGEEVIRCLRGVLAESVGAREQHRGHHDSRPPIRNEQCVPHEKCRHEYVGQVVDDIVELAAVEPGCAGGDVGAPGKNTVRGVNDEGEREPEEGVAIPIVEDAVEREKGAECAAGRVQVDEPDPDHAGRLYRATETLSHRENQNTLCLCDSVACWNDL